MKRDSKPDVDATEDDHFAIQDTSMATYVTFGGNDQQHSRQAGLILHLFKGGVTFFLKVAQD